MPTWEISEDIAYLLLLLSTATHRRVDQNGIHYTKGNYYDGAIKYYINDYDPVYLEKEGYVDKNPSDEESENL